MERRVYNWSRHTACVPAARAAPASEAYVAALVSRASSARGHVKVIGGGHSLSDIGMTDGTLLSLDRMRAVLHVDSTACQVTVQAGIRLYGLVAELDTRGLALSILGSITQQSIAGAISTGTHGWSLRHSNLASFVRGMRLVTARGAILDLDERDERLAAAPGRARRPWDNDAGDDPVRAPVRARRSRRKYLHWPPHTQPRRSPAALST